MSLFARSSIKRKLTFIIMAASSASLLLACCAILLVEVAGFKSILLRNTRVLAEVIGANSAAELSFNYREAAAETLSALKGEPYVVSACVYTKSGDLFASYTHSAKVQVPAKVPLQGDTFTFDKETLNLSHDIYLDGDRVGTLFIQSDLSVLRERFQTYLRIIAIVMAAAVLLAFILSLRLQSLISKPIGHLAQVANRVARENNYSIRAVRTSTDEMGQLIDRFNEMLAGIQERDAALLRGREELERRVDERTSELQLEISERARVEAELRISRQKFETLVNSIEAVVWEADPRTHQFTFVSQQAERLLGFARSEWTNDPSFWIKHVSEKDQAIVQDRRLKASEQEKPFQMEYRMVAQDGRTVWVREISTCTLDTGAAPTLRGVLFDITEQKRAEEELDLLHRRLLESSRQAGMAEVATGVLHNVGNVLNSVNVSSTLITEQVRNSRAARLKGVVALLKDNATDLGNFITANPKGKVIPSYLNSLSDRLCAEQEGVLKELDLLTKNIEHIKEIVAMQQSYARVSGMIESLPIRTLVEDALQMNAAAMARHGILVVKEFEEVPPAAVDKHKVLQILVNLLRNAKYAIDAAAQREKKITIQIRRAGPRMIAIFITDNGIGIPSENLTRIFSHGFTTKKDGHGFGLHSGALAAREMGGSLRAYSEGTGKGATFVLELPLNAEREGTTPAIESKAI